jgi:hypothetical protein
MKNKELPHTPTLASKINRNFYRSLRARGRTHGEIIRMIQPERREQFLKDSRGLYLIKK